MRTGASPCSPPPSELAEETGYTARRWTQLNDALSSPGLTDERITFFHAAGLSRAADDGGGVGEESIRVLEVPLDAIPAQLAAWRDRGTAVDMKLLAGLYAAAAIHTRESR